MPESPKKNPVVPDYGIKFISASNSFDGCIVKFWMHDKGWEYRIDGALLDYVKDMAHRSAGAAFNFCKKHAINTYGPYNLKWELIDNDKLA